MDMKETADTLSTQERLELLTGALDAGATDHIRRLLIDIHPAEIADLLESFPHGPREILWELVASDDCGETLVHVNDEVRTGLIEQMEPRELVAATEDLDPDDLADLVQDLPGTVTRELLRAMDQQNRDRLEAVLFYPG